MSVSILTACPFLGFSNEHFPSTGLNVFLVRASLLPTALATGEPAHDETSRRAPVTLYVVRESVCPGSPRFQKLAIPVSLRLRACYGARRFGMCTGVRPIVTSLMEACFVIVSL